LTDSFFVIEKEWVFCKIGVGFSNIIDEKMSCRLQRVMFTTSGMEQITEHSSGYDTSNCP
jgi:hypothetical protein